MTPAEEIAKELQDSYESWVQAKLKKGKYNATGNRASDLGKCPRYIYYTRTAGTEARDWSPEAVQRMEEGVLQETSIRRFLLEQGYEILEAQKPVYWKKYQIVGRIDGTIIKDKIKVVVEIKTTSYGFDVENWRDLYQDEWKRSWLEQILIYMLAEDTTQGLLILKDRSSFRLKFIPIILDEETLDIAEKLIQKAIVVNEAIAKGEPPEGINEPKCLQCRFYELCNPPLEFKGFETITDKELLKKIARLYELEESGVLSAYAEREKLRREIQSILEKIDADDVIAGNYLLTKKIKRWTGYNVPEEIKKQYKISKEIITFKIKAINPLSHAHDSTPGRR